MKKFDPSKLIFTSGTTICAGSSCACSLSFDEPVTSQFWLCLMRDGGETTLIPLRAHEDRCTFSGEQLMDEPGLYWAWILCFENNTMLHSSLSGEWSQRKEYHSIQITVYDKNYTTPEWFSKGVVYHIFVDRFCRAGDVPKVEDGRVRNIHTDWNEAPQVWENPLDVTNDDFFGGNLRGILSKLPYLKSLGVGTLYLSPIFESPSNHKYDTGDYKRIDPMFGDEETLKELCRRAKEMGIRVILDAVLNHTGWDSRYFNAFGRYDEPGAAQSQDSPYAQWYTFQEFPGKYDCWWGVPSLPAVNENCESYRQFTLSGGDSVLKHWLRAGVSGYRLDVADELPDAYLKILRNAVKETAPDAIIIGEVWEDASNKISYDVRREYFQGRELDGVMNYPAREGILRFLKGEISADDFAREMNGLYDHYPLLSQRCLMNGIGTHDTPRIINILGMDESAFHLTKHEKAARRLTPEEYARGKRLLMLASLLQYAQPGAPCIYYGDEAGLDGFEDPLNRRTYPWGKEDQELIGWYQRLGQIRSENAALQAGTAIHLVMGPDVIAVIRKSDHQEIMIAVNRSAEKRIVRLPDGFETAQICLNHGNCALQENNLILSGCGALVLYRNC